MPKSILNEEGEDSDIRRGGFSTLRAVSTGFLKVPRRLARCWKKSWHYLLAIAIVIAITYTALDVYATAQLNHQLNLIHLKGEPLTLAEAAPPKIPDEQNAAILYERAAAVLKLKAERMFPPKNVSQKEIDAILSKNADAITFIRQATQKPHCHFDLDWKNQHRFLMPDKTNMMQDLSWLLTQQVWHDIEIGNNKVALQDVHRLFIMTQHLSNDPVMSHANIALRMEKSANYVLANVLLHISLPVAQAHNFETSIPTIDWDKVVYHALLTTRASLIAFYNIMSSTDFDGFDLQSPPLSHWQDWLWWHIKLLRKLDETSALDILQNILKAKNAPVNKTMDYENNLNQKITNSLWSTRHTKKSFHFLVGRRIEFNCVKVQRLEREIALALAVYHTKYKKYPATLQEAETLWKSTFPSDPYSNKPFRYKSDGKTFLLYSVGMDGKDNGGRWRENSASAITTDIVWGH